MQCVAARLAELHGGRGGTSQVRNTNRQRRKVNENLQRACREAASAVQGCVIVPGYNSPALPVSPSDAQALCHYFSIWQLLSKILSPLFKTTV